jgi:hypothetical protein
MSNKLVTIAEYADSSQAELARQVLADYGIQALIMDQNTSNLWQTALPWSTTKLQVLESDADHARQILEEQQQDAHEPEDYEVGDDSDDSDEPYEPDEEEK